MIDPRLILRADARQLTLPKNELIRLANRVQMDYRAAIADHDARMRRFTRYYRRWRNLTDLPAAGEEQNPNFFVPITQWEVYTKWAKEHNALFGETADVQAKPIGPSDQRNSRKASRFMTWAVFDHIKVQNPASTLNFRKILFGRSHALADWRRQTYWVPLIDGTEAEQVSYEGPGFEPIWPDDLIVPAEDVQSIHQFSWVLRKYRATPEDLLDGEEAGIYQGISDDYDEFYNFASHKKQRDFEGEMMKREKDLAEGVVYEGNLSAGNTLIIHEWYGKWRLPKGKRDVGATNFAGRDRRETELVVRYVPMMHRVIGVQRLDEMYPRKKNRRPFVETSLVKEGSYWSPGFGEMLELVEDELTAFHRAASKAAAFSIGPVIFYKPASGFDPDTFTYEPGTSVACDDPNGIRVVELKADLTGNEIQRQSLMAMGERVVGQSDMNMGRTIDRPNAPRTARQTLALLGEGDVRASLELTALREDWGAILTHFWELYQEYAPEKLFFRVTEEDANGLFDTKNGGAYMTSEELGSLYDFEMKFATSAASREQQKQDDLMLYQIDLQNPLILSNPRALWSLMDRVHKAFGDDHFSDVVPTPPDLGQPKTPKEEYALILQGEEIQVNPLDNDQLHLLDHSKRMDDMRQDPDADQDAFRSLALHIVEHQQQVEKKRLMQQMVQSTVEALRQNTATGQGLMHQPMPTDLAQVHQTLGNYLVNSQPGMQPPGMPGIAAPMQPPQMPEMMGPPNPGDSMMGPQG